MEGYRLYELLAVFAVYSVLGWLLEEILVNGLCGSRGKRGFLKGPCSMMAGIAGLAGTLLLTKVPDIPVRFGIIVCGAMILNCLCILLVKSISGRILWKLSIPATLLFGLVTFTATTDLTPILRVIVTTVPAKAIWLPLVIFYLWMWQDFVDSVGALMDYKKYGESPERWRAYGWKSRPAEQ